MKENRTIGVFLALALVLTCAAQTAEASERHVSDWAASEVEKAERAGLLAALTADRDFVESLGSDYTADITRGQFASLAVGLVETAVGTIWNPHSMDEPPFGDTTSYAVKHANEVGIILGAGDGNFYPDQTLTREALATMLYRTIKVVDENAVPASVTLGSFEDADRVADWACDAVGGMVGCGILQGVTGNKLAPKERVSIEQAIVLTYRTFAQAIEPQARRLAENYVSQKTADTQAALGGSRVDSLRMVEIDQKGRANFILYSLAYSRKADGAPAEPAPGGQLAEGAVTPEPTTILVLQRGAEGKYLCQGGFLFQYEPDINNAEFCAEFEQFLANGTAQPYDYPQSGKITNTIGAFDGKTYQYTPTQNVTMEEIAWALSTQVLDSIAQRDDTTYQVLDYHVTAINNIKFVEDDGEPYWTAWPAFEMKYTGWYGLIGPSDGAWYISKFETDGGMSRVRIDEKNGTYTLRCWAP